MRYAALFRFVVKRFFSKRNLIIFAVLSIIFLYSGHYGAVEYKSIINDSHEFKKIEDQLFDTIADYTEYSERGVNVFFHPTVLGAFFSNPPMFSELSGKVNSIFALNIYNNCKDGIVLGGNSSLRFRFSTLVLVFLSLAALFLGCELMCNREFLMVLVSQWSPLKVYLTMVITRLLLIALSFLAISALGVLLLRLESVPISWADIVRLGLSMIPAFIMFIILFLIGTILGMIKKTFSRTASILAIWILLVFYWPMFIDSIVTDKSTSIPSSHQSDNRKLKIVNDFEKKYIKERGGAKNYTPEEAREIVEGYWNNEFRQVEKVDEDLRVKISSVIEDYMNISVLAPTSFYNLTCHELSGRGYSSYLSFFKYLQDLRREFSRFWIDRKYYNDPKVMKNFVTGDENIFRSRSHLPPVFWRGVLINLSYIVILAFLSYLSFKRSLYRLTSEETSKLEDLEINLKRGQLIVKLIKGNVLSNALFTVFSGEINGLIKNGFKGKILLDSVNITEEKRKNRFLYMCRPSELPGDILVKDLLDFYRRWTNQPLKKKALSLNVPGMEAFINKRVDRLEDDEAFHVIMALLQMSESQVYLINDVTSGLPVDYAVQFKEVIDGLTHRGFVAVYLTMPHMLEVDTIKKGKCFVDGEAWVYFTDSKKEIKKIGRGKKDEEGK